MTPITSGCSQNPIGRIGCDMDFTLGSCRVCEAASREIRKPGYWNSYEVYNGLNDPSTTLHIDDEIGMHSLYKYGLCGWTIRDAKAVHLGGDTFEHCKTVTHEDVMDEIIIPRRKPSIGANGRFCVCIQPKELQSFEVPLSDIQEKEKRIQSQKESRYSVQSPASESEVSMELYQSDFEYGTYRITKPGTLTGRKLIEFYV